MVGTCGTFNRELGGWKEEKQNKKTGDAGLFLTKRHSLRVKREIPLCYF